MSSIQGPYPAPQPADDGLRGHASACKRVRYDDDDDDFEIGHRRGTEENESSAGVVGFIFAGVAIGLLLVVLILWIFLNKEEMQQPGNVDRKRWMLYWFMFLDVLSFFAVGVASDFRFVIGG